MDTTDQTAEPAPDAVAERLPLKVFINYRRRDAGGWAVALYERLAARFGSATTMCFLT